MEAGVLPMRNGGQKGLHALEPHRPLPDFCVHLGHPQARPAAVFLSNPHHFHPVLVLGRPSGFFLCFSASALYKAELFPSSVHESESLPPLPSLTPDPLRDLSNSPETEIDFAQEGFLEEFIFIVCDHS